MDTLGEEFDALIMKVFNSYDSMNVFINRVKPYNPSGRFQTEAESDELSNVMRTFLDNHNVVCTCLPKMYAWFWNTALLSSHTLSLANSVTSSAFTPFTWEDVILSPCKDTQHQYQKFLLADCNVVVDGPFKH